MLFRNLLNREVKRSEVQYLFRFLSRNHPKILMYHRITNCIEDEGLLVEQFKKQINIIRENFVPLALSEMLEQFKLGTLPKNSVCITFDDGYWDFSDIAFPILKEAGLPVTLFLTTGFVSGEIWLWPDQIRYALENSKVPSFELSAFPGKTFDVSSGGSMSWSEIANYCLGQSNYEKNKLITSLYQKLEVVLPESAPEKYRSVTWEQVRSMCAEGLEVGSHSRSHPILTKLSDSELREEVFESKYEIKKEIGVEPRFFCYPNGQKDDFDARVKQVVRSAGYEYGVAAFPGLSPLRDNWALQRYPIGLNMEFFEKSIFGVDYVKSWVRK